MKTLQLFICSVVALALSACGYHLGGLKPTALKDMNTFCVEVFENQTLHPNAGMLMTTAMANALQSDGTYRMAPQNEADFVVRGAVTRIVRESLITDTEDTYISKQIGACVYVKYQIVNRKTGEVLLSSEETETASYFNQLGSTESAQEAAISYATRRIAEEIVIDLVTE